MTYRSLPGIRIEWLAAVSHLVHVNHGGNLQVEDHSTVTMSILHEIGLCPANGKIIEWPNGMMERLLDGWKDYPTDWRCELNRRIAVLKKLHGDIDLLSMLTFDPVHDRRILALPRVKPFGQDVVDACMNMDPVTIEKILGVVYQVPVPFQMEVAKALFGE